nr:hypothetical protein [uncultured Capnocytophaga sp.]
MRAARAIMGVMGVVRIMGVMGCEFVLTEGFNFAKVWKPRL